MRPARLIATLLLALGTGCVAYVRPARVAVAVPVGEVAYLEREPPPVRVEAVPAAPTIEHVWVAGHWAWSGRGYVWVAGRHVLRPRPGAVWVPGHWSRHPRGWFWTDGRWR